MREYIPFIVAFTLCIAMITILALRQRKNRNWQSKLKPGDYVSMSFMNMVTKQLDRITGVVLDNYISSKKLSVKYNIEFDQKSLYSHIYYHGSPRRVVHHFESRPTTRQERREFFSSFKKYSKKIKDGNIDKILGSGRSRHR